MLRVDLPEVIQRFIDSERQGRPLLLTTASDIDMTGRFNRQWLAIAADRIWVVAEGSAPTLVKSLPIAGLTGFRAHGVIGSGFLQAQIDGVWVDVLRYSNSLGDRFTKVARKLEELRNKGAIVIDPADDKDDRRCPKCDLVLAFVGDVCPRCIPRRAIASRVWELIRRHLGKAAILLLLLVLGVAFELAPAKLTQYLIDDVLMIDNQSELPDKLTLLFWIVAAVALSSAMSALISALRGMMAARIGVDLTADMRTRLVKKLNELSVGYYDRHQDGALVNRVVYDSEAMHALIYHSTAGSSLLVLKMLGIGFLLFSMNPQLAFFTLAPMPLVLGASVFFWRRIYPRHYRYWDSTAKQAGMLTGMVAGMRVVKAFTQEKREYERFRDQSNALRNARLSVESASSIFGGVMQVLLGLGSLIVWSVGGREVLGHTMTLGQLTAFLALLAMFYTPMSTIAELTTWISSFMTASQRIFELLDTPLDIMEPARPTPIPNGLTGHIRFENVTFGYERHRMVLENLSLEIKPGEMVGIVGHSGSGKSTLINLLSRFYDVSGGRITIDDIDIRDLKTDDLRSQVGLVLQEPMLFKGTIEENVVYGRPGASPEQVIEAAKIANAHDFIVRMPFGYDAAIAERGGGLSGGEKQRVSIARAVLYNPRILVLDEATSSIDVRSERAIQSALERFSRNRTTIAIAHRLSTLKNADRIIVMDNGKLVEQGTHRELLDKGGLYADLVRIQTQLTREKVTVDYLNAKRAKETSDETPKELENEEAEVEEGDDAELDTLLRWLYPNNTHVRVGAHDTLHVIIDDKEVYSGAYAARSFPATRPEEFISLRYFDAHGRDREIGVVRNMADFPPEQRLLIKQALDRRYFLRAITKLEAIDLKFGFLSFKVQTDGGPAAFLMRWSEPNALDFGKGGKIIIDVDDNRYLIPDLANLTKREQSMFRRQIYW